jgi:hypothetical protein
VDKIWAGVTIVVILLVCLLMFGCSHTKETKISYYESGAKLSEETVVKSGILLSEGKEFSIIKIN